MPTTINQANIINTLQTKMPNLLAIYAFGSQINGTATPTSDLDLAVLVAGLVEPLMLWELAQQLANQTGCDVDLVDLRAASTVFQYQIITTGQRWWQCDAQAEIYESFILSEKIALDTLRFDLLQDIQREGKIYDR